MSSHPAQNIIKNVLRTALIGIKPADQLIIKGYLRVLLRLEVDLEWVSANHPQVDLFLINHEFRDASSIVKLLANQANKPVLYTSRTDVDEGWMLEDRLILPLKKLNALNNWLLHSVKVLNNSAGLETTSTKPDKIMSESTYQQQVSVNSNEAALADYPNNEGTQMLVSATSLSPSIPQITLPSQAQNYQGIIKLIKKIQQRPSGVYNILAGEQTVAIIEPCHSLVWLSESPADNTTLPMTLDWNIQPYNGELPAVESATDMMQYLWQRAWIHADILLPLISDNSSYQLRYWIKPVLMAEEVSTTLSKKDRQSLLSIMTALEFAPCNVNQLAMIASISIKSVKKIVASLLFSGSLDVKSYAQLDVRITTQATIKSASLLSAESLIPHSTMTAQGESNQSTLISTVPSLHSNPDSEVGNVHAFPAKDVSLTAITGQKLNQEDRTTPSIQQEKQGFLSRLRVKLGL